MKRSHRRWRSRLERYGRGCPGLVRRCVSSLAISTSACGFSINRPPGWREEVMNAPDEIDLLQRFREDAPGPSATAWACARPASEAARALETQAGPALRPGPFSGPRPERI